MGIGGEMRRRLAWVFGVVLVASACSTPTPPTAQSPSPSGPAGGVGGLAEVVDPDAQLVTSVGVFGEPRTIDPALARIGPELETVRNVYEGLLVLDPATLRVSPGAAEALPTVSADGTRFTFTLRPGLTYSDGQPLTAADFAYAFARSCDGRTRSLTNTVLYAIRGCERLATMDAQSHTEAEFASAYAELGVKALDDRRIEFVTVEPAPFFPAITTLPPAMPVRRSDVEKGDSWTEPGSYVGNGPFRLGAWTRGEAMIFERNERYRLPVKLKSWKILMMRDRAVEFAAYQNDQLDIMEFSTEEMRAIQADPRLRQQVVKVPRGCTTLYVFNTTRPPFDDPLVRLAFAKAVDRTDLAQKVLGGIGYPADRGLIPPGHPGHDDGDRTQSFDPAAAKRLLAESRYAGALPPITWSIWSTNVNSLHGQWLREQWKANLGVDITSEPIENQVYQQLISSADTAPQIFYTGWCTDVPDPYNFYVTLWATGGVLATRSGYSDPEVDAALQKALEATDPSVRATLYQEAGRLLSKDAPAVWVYYNERPSLVKPWVKGLRPSARGVSALGKHEIYLIKH